jgi:hypothetical protein
MLQVAATGIEEDEEKNIFLDVCFYKFFYINEIMYHVSMTIVLTANCRTRYRSFIDFSCMSSWLVGWFIPVTPKWSIGHP